MGIRKIATLALLGALAAVGARAGAPAQKPVPAQPAAESNEPPVASSSGAELSKRDADAWLDGFMPNALAGGDIAGGVVVIVKDGKILPQRGYGYADIAA